MIVNKELGSMYDDIFKDRGVVPCEPVCGLNPIGDCFRMLPDRGEGYAWVYHVNPHVTITIKGYSRPRMKAAVIHSRPD